MYELTAQRAVADPIVRHIELQIPVAQTIQEQQQQQEQIRLISLFHCYPGRTHRVRAGGTKSGNSTVRSGREDVTAEQSLIDQREVLIDGDVYVVYTGGYAGGEVALAVLDQVQGVVQEQLVQVVPAGHTRPDQLEHVCGRIVQ